MGTRIDGQQNRQQIGDAQNTIKLTTDNHALHCSLSPELSVRPAVCSGPWSVAELDPLVPSSHGVLGATHVRIVHVSARARRTVCFHGIPGRSSEAPLWLGLFAILHWLVCSRPWCPRCTPLPAGSTCRILGSVIAHQGPKIIRAGAWVVSVLSVLPLGSAKAGLCGHVVGVVRAVLPRSGDVIGEARIARSSTKSEVWRLVIFVDVRSCGGVCTWTGRRVRPPVFRLALYTPLGRFFHRRQVRNQWVGLAAIHRHDAGELAFTHRYA